MFGKRYENAQLGYLRVRVEELEEKYFSLLMLINKVAAESGLFVEYRPATNGHYEVGKKGSPEKGE